MIRAKEARAGITFASDWRRLETLLEAEDELKLLCARVQPDLAPGLARKLRSALKSCQGAIRNARRFVAQAERKS